jgi:hypothetical protein
MKIHALATLAFITANRVKAQLVEVENPVENPCVICPNGATAGDDLAPGADVGVLTTCKELIETASLVETGTLSCAFYGFYEATCCPPVSPPQDPCTFCPNGVTVADDIATSYGCSDKITEFSLIESESDTCTFMREVFEYYCCPAPPENPCNVCPNGATAGGYICMQLINQANQLETGSVLCGYIEAYKNYCCPDVNAYTTAVPVEETSTQDSCEACPNGATFTGEFEFEGVSMTCSDLISFAILFAPGSAECASFADVATVCCPPVAENPCEVCPDGVTFDGEFEVEGVSVTCSDIISLAMGLESGSDECVEVPREEMELICCPSEGIPEIGGGTVATTDIPVEINDGTATTTIVPAVETTSTSATAPAVPEINDGTATTTTAPVVETSTPTNATASAESTDVASGGVTIISGFGGFSFVSVVSALWAIGFV